MANKEFHELITAEELSSSDVIAEQRNNSGTWLTRKLTFNALGLFLNKMLDYASELHTTSKTIIGAINELAQGSGQSLDTLNDVDIDDQTLADGQGIVYDATAQKWKNGAVSGGGHAYSTTEQVVGTWIDGSTLYERTIEYSHTTQGAQTVSLPTGVVWSNIKNIVAIVKNETDVQSTYVFDATNRFSVRTNSTDGIIVTMGSSYPAVPATVTITIRYTKSST